MTRTIDSLIYWAGLSERGARVRGAPPWGLYPSPPPCLPPALPLLLLPPVLAPPSEPPVLKRRFSWNPSKRVRLNGLPVSSRTFTACTPLSVFWMSKFTCKKGREREGRGMSMREWGRTRTNQSGQFTHFLAFLEEAETTRLDHRLVDEDCRREGERFIGGEMRRCR